MEPLHTFSDLIQYIEDNHSNPFAFNYLENGEWRHISTESFIFDLKRLTLGLISLGLQKGEKVGILADSSPFWNQADFAIIMAGGISVPLFSRISHDEFIYECAQANIRFLFVQGEENWALYDEHRNLFEKVIGIDAPKTIEGALKFHDVLVMGEGLWEKKPKLWQVLAHQSQADSVCTIIYTAGSTGMPKGVQLTHQNLCHLISFQLFNWETDEDKYLSILPLAHVFARQINLILIACGVSVYYLTDLSRMPEVLKDIQPSLMIVVPRVLERMYGAMQSRIEKLKDGWQKSFVSWAFNLASDLNPPFFKKFFSMPIADWLVYSEFRKSFGGKWKTILCGGAALDPVLNQFFLHIGIPVYEGWGLTEGSTLCVNRPNAQKVGTVGKPLPGVKVKLGENDELLITGPTLMKGYYRNPTATEAAIDNDGWLHTGDKGKIDKDGFVKIVGRVKAQFKLSSGEYLVPARIEYMLQKHPLIDLALVIGEKRKYAACLLFPDPAMIKKLKEELGLPGASNEEILNSSSVKKEMDSLLDQVNGRINSWEKLVKYRFIVDSPPTVERGELTPTLEVKRDVILKNYEELVNSIYGEEVS